MIGLRGAARVGAKVRQRGVGALPTVRQLINKVNPLVFGEDSSQEERDLFLRTNQPSDYFDPPVTTTLRKHYPEVRLASKSSVLHLMREYITDQFVSLVMQADPKLRVIYATSLLHVNIHPTMLLVASLQRDERASWYSYALSEVDVTGSRDGKVVMVGDIITTHHHVTDIHRMTSRVGVYRDIDFDGRTIRGYIDMVCDDDDPDYIVFGDVIHIDVDIDGDQYVSYRHPDSIYSKTHVAHFRLGKVWRNSIVGGTRVVIPSMLLPMLKYAYSRFVVGNKCSLVLELPDPTDLSRLIAASSRTVSLRSSALVYMCITNPNHLFLTLDDLYRHLDTRNINYHNPIVGGGSAVRYLVTDYVLAQYLSDPTSSMLYKSMFDLS